MEPLTIEATICLLIIAVCFAYIAYSDHQKRVRESENQQIRRAVAEWERQNILD